MRHTVYTVTIKKGRKKYRFSRILCFGLLCSLFLCGCGPEAASSRERQSAIQAGALRAAANAVWESFADKAADIPSGTAEAESLDEILALLIADEGFRERVRYGTGLSEGDSAQIVLQKLEDCERIVLEEAPYGAPIYSLEALCLMPNLKQLVIDIGEWDDSSITDFTPVLQLSQLEQIYIHYEKEAAVDLSFLGQIHTVTELFLPNCNIADISFLAQMPQLERLSLYETPVADLAVLEKLPKLVELSLSGNKNARHIEAVGTLTQLQDLGLQYCGIEDISFLKGLTQLRGINLNGNAITDITPLAGMDKLERVGLSENGISDISALKGFTNLFDLALDGNEIQDISVLAGLPHLNQVGISNNHIEDLSPLTGMKELVYVAVFGNPVRSLKPVWDVPLLLCMDVGVSEEEKKTIAAWLEAQYPEAAAYECVDFTQGDLNGDGRTDIAFVVDCEAFDIYEEDFAERMPEDRRLFILLQQPDGSWQELRDTPALMSSTSGGMRGDPYRGIFIEDGVLLVKESWGSSGGGTAINHYVFQNGSLILTRTVSVEDYAYADGYDVDVRDEQRRILQWYVIAMDGYRMVRVDLTNTAHPYHRAFPQIDLYNMSYYIHHDKPKTRITAAEALDMLCAARAEGAIAEELPYAVWQKENYELLTGIALPEYYYVLPGTAQEAAGPDNSQKEAWEGDYIYYKGIEYIDEALYHVIDYVYYAQESHRTWNTTYLVEDATGEISER